MPVVLQKKLTYEDYLQMTPPDSGNYQLIHGEIISMTSPSSKHQKCIVNLTFLIQSYLLNKPIGKLFIAPMDVILEAGEVYQPDLLFISGSRDYIIEESKINGVPDLIIEVLSPSNAYYDLVIKKKVYEVCEVMEYWIVDPIQKSLDLYILSGNKFHLRQQLEKIGNVSTEILSGIDLDIEKVFK